MTKEVSYESQFDPSTFTEGGGGLWDGKVVQITSASIKVASFGPFNVAEINGIAEGEDKERHQSYFLDSDQQPSADGEGIDYRDPQLAKGVNGPGGRPAPIKLRSYGVGRFLKELVASGFDMKRLVKDGKPHFGGLVGARIRFKAEGRVNRDGTPKKNEKKFQEQDFYPVQTIGYADGTVAKVGNGADLSAKAVTAVLAAAKAAGGSINRAALVPALAKGLNGDPESGAVISLAVSEAFLKTVPGTTYAGATLSIS